MLEPIPFTTTRYRCPCCPRTASSKARMRTHVGRCWLNPEVRSCKTCKHFERYSEFTNYGDGCELGIDLTGRPQCPDCHGLGQTFDRGTLGASECPTCGGNGEEIKPGPIVHCDRWEAA